MDDELLQQLAQKYINRDKWWEIISRFIEVLRMNIFVIDAKDRLLLPPEEARFGGRFLVDESFKTNIHRSGGYINKFLKHGVFLEEKNQFKLFSYAIPIKLNENQVLAFMVIGPVILNKRLSVSEYEQLAIQNILNISPDIKIIKTSAKKDIGVDDLVNLFLSSKAVKD